MGQQLSYPLSDEAALYMAAALPSLPLLITICPHTFYMDFVFENLTLCALDHVDVFLLLLLFLSIT